MLIDPKGDEKKHWREWTVSQRVGLVLVILAALGSLCLGYCVPHLP